MDNMKISAILYSIVAIIFILCAATGGSPAFYGGSAAFIALAAASYPKKDKKDCEHNGSTECVIVYGGFYGGAKQYAQNLSEQTGIPAISYKDEPSLSNMRVIIYIGGLYAGGVRGLTKTLRNFHLRDNQKLILVTVGLADPNEQENRDNIRVFLQKQLSPELLQKTKLFHFRGRIDYNKLTFVHSIMMKLRYQSLRKKPLETLTTEDRTFINTYGKQASFIDFNALKPIIKEIYLPVERVP